MLTHAAYQTSGLLAVLLLPEGRMGDLILRWASHLDAFSVYPIRTWLPSIAAGATTDTP
jgi:hypothetical protein